MTIERATGTYGFRFAQAAHLAMCGLFAVGSDVIRDPGYRWDGLTRTDGPLFLFQYTLSGEGLYESAGQTHRVGAGRAFMAEIPGDHRYYFPEGGSHWAFLFILMRPNVIAPNWTEARERLGEVPELPASSRPIRLLQAIWDEANAGRITDPYTASSYVYQFVSELCRFASAPRDDRRDWPAAVCEAAAYIESHYARMLSLDQLSERLGVSKYHFIRIFTAAAGVTPGDYLTRVRIEQAVRLLRQTDWSVERIAGEVGYSGGSYFIKAFRRMTGVTPGSFRAGEGQLLYNRLFFD